MIDEIEFTKKYENEIPIFTAWGKFVDSQIISALTTYIGSIEKLDLFLKIPSKPRTKDTNSIVSKAFYRDKNYEDPYTEITDKVGVRYVVLLKEDIKKVSNLISSNPVWRYSKDRDFEEEKLRNPYMFDYQSDHYIVINKQELEFEGISIPSDTPCEIQIRTLLQHAYAELTHDTVYKPKTRVVPSVQRMLAKSMALIETTDDIFSEVEVELRKADEKVTILLENLQRIYESFASEDYEKNINYYILDAYRDLIEDIQISEIERFAGNTKLIRDIIERNHDKFLLYRQPIVLLIMYLIANKRDVFTELWPLTNSELRPLFTDLGVAYDNNI